MATFKDSPNPLTLSIALGQSVLKQLDHFDAHRTDGASAGYFPLGAAILKHEGVLSVLISKDTDGTDYLSIRKTNRSWTQSEKDWVLSVVDYFTKGNVAMIHEDTIIKSGAQAKKFVPNTVSEKIISDVFMQVMLPVVKGHGGNFVIHRVVENADKTVDAEISLQGACSGCDMSKKATLMAAKAQLRRYMRAVEDKNDNLSFGSIVVYDPTDLKTPQFKV